MINVCIRSLSLQDTQRTSFMNSKIEVPLHKQIHGGAGKQPITDTVAYAGAGSPEDMGVESGYGFA